MDPQQKPEVSYKIGCTCSSIHPSVHPSVFCQSRHFLGIVSFSKFWYAARDPYEVVLQGAGFSIKNFCCPQNWENGLKMGQKQVFLNLLKHLMVNFYWICFIMKIYIVCYVPAQIPYFKNFLFIRYQPNCSELIRLPDFLINHISKTKQGNSLIQFFLCWYKFP